MDTHSTTQPIPKGLKLFLGVTWILALAAILFVGASCDTAPVVSAQEIASSAVELATADGLDPAALTPEQAEHYATLAAQAWAKEHAGQTDWKGWASTALQILLGGNATLALLTGRGRSNLATMIDREATTRDRIGSALAILIGTRSPPAASPAPTASSPPPTQ